MGLSPQGRWRFPGNHKLRRDPVYGCSYWARSPVGERGEGTISNSRGKSSLMRVGNCFVIYFAPNRVPLMPLEKVNKGCLNQDLLLKY